MTDDAGAPAADCLERTRSAVLDVLVAAGFGIAVSGWLLRWRDRWAASRAPQGVGRGLSALLVLLAVASFVVRRLAASGGRPADSPARRAARFYRGHVTAAALAALGVPLGLVYGWLVRPRLDVVGPFWVVALTLGFLALPRSRDLGALRDGPGPEPGGPGTTSAPPP